MIIPIAIEFPDTVISMPWKALHDEIKVEVTTGVGLKFDLDGKKHYAAVRDASDIPNFPGWFYLNGKDYREESYDPKDFHALCLCDGYLYGFQATERDLDAGIFCPIQVVLGGWGNTYRDVARYKVSFFFNYKNLCKNTIQHFIEALDDEYNLAQDEVVDEEDDVLSDYNVLADDAIFHKSKPGDLPNDTISNSASKAERTWLNCSFSKPDTTTKKENKTSMNFNISNSLLKNLRCGKAGEGFGISLFDGSVTYKGHSYNGSALVETAGFELDAGDFLFIMPTNSIQKGDIVALQNDVAYYTGDSFISLTTGAKTDYVPISCFGMTFYSVVRNMLGNFGGATGGNANPMANLLPLMLLDKGSDSDDLMKMMLLMNGGLNFNFNATNSNNSNKAE